MENLFHVSQPSVSYSLVSTSLQGSDNDGNLPKIINHLNCNAHIGRTGCVRRERELRREWREQFAVVSSLYIGNCVCVCSVGRGRAIGKLVFCCFQLVFQPPLGHSCMDFCSSSLIVVGWSHHRQEFDFYYREFSSNWMFWRYLNLGLRGKRTLSVFSGDLTRFVQFASLELLGSLGLGFWYLSALVCACELMNAKSPWDTRLICSIPEMFGLFSLSLLVPALSNFFFFPRWRPLGNCLASPMENSSFFFSFHRAFFHLSSPPREKEGSKKNGKWKNSRLSSSRSI